MSYRIAFIFVGDYTTGSSRLIGYNTHDYLINRGIMSKILCPIEKINKPDYFDYYPAINTDEVIAGNYDLVVFQKVRGNAVLETIQTCKKRRIKTIYCLDDWRPESAQVAMYCDLVITPSFHIKEKMFANHSRVEIIRHGYEGPIEKYKAEYRHNDRMCYVYGAKYIPETLMPLLNSSGWQLTTIGRHKTDTYKWDLSTIYDNIMSCDIGIVPADITTNEGLSKSNVRALSFMILGLPVIVSAVPEYYSLVRNGINGFVAYTQEDWIKYLKALKDPVLCEKMGRQARIDAIKYTKANTYEEYHRLFYKMAKERWMGK